MFVTLRKESAMAPKHQWIRACLAHMFTATTKGTHKIHEVDWLSTSVFFYRSQGLTQVGRADVAVAAPIGSARGLTRDIIQDFSFLSPSLPSFQSRLETPPAEEIGWFPL